MNAFALRSTLWDDWQKEPQHPGGGKNWGLLEDCEDSSKHLSPLITLGITSLLETVVGSLPEESLRQRRPEMYIE